MSTAHASRSNVGAIAIVGALFFIFGFVTWLNGPLIQFAKLAFDVSDSRAFLIPFAFYISYFCLALPSSAILRKTGMKKGMALGLLVMAIGLLAFFVPSVMMLDRDAPQNTPIPSTTELSKNEAVLN